MTMLKVQIIYADKAEHAWTQQLSLALDTTIEQAIEQSDFKITFPQIEWRNLGLGVFGLKQSAAYVLQDGDRVELYRGLNFDPKVSRKRRALHRKAGILKKKHLKPDRSKRIEYDDYTKETK